MSKAPLMPSEVDILKTKAANKKGAGSEEVETVWPKPEFVCHASLLPSRTDRSFSPSVFFFFPCRVCERLMAAGQRERSSGSLHWSWKVGSSEGGWGDEGVIERCSGVLETARGISAQNVWTLTHRPGFFFFSFFFREWLALNREQARRWTMWLQQGRRSPNT